jgi:electron transfer flavoprotein alpha subunit
MSGILVVAETRAGALRDVSFELVGAGRAVAQAAGVPLQVAVVDAEPERFAEALSAEGVAELLLVRAPAPHFDPRFARTAIEALIAELDPDVVLMGHTVDALGVGPAVAAVGGLGFASDVVALRWEDGLVACRGAYADKLVAELDFPGKPRVLALLRPGAFAPAEAGVQAGAVRELAVAAGEPSVEHAGYREPADDGGVDITKADFLLSIGRGIEDADHLPRFEALAERIGAVLSVSRPLVDAGWASNARQVGQSGKTVAPRVYLALGISGAVQHVAGMRGAGTVIAVNTDPEAPIFNVADYAAVADLFEVADELERLAG